MIMSADRRGACVTATCDNHHTTVPCVTTAYVCNHTHRWLESFESMESSQQIGVMELCFGSLPSQDEKQLVVATFM